MNNTQLLRLKIKYKTCDCCMVCKHSKSQDDFQLNCKLHNMIVDKNCICVDFDVYHSNYGVKE